MNAWTYRKSLREDDGGKSRVHSATSAQLRANLKRWREIVLVDQFEPRRLMIFALVGRIHNV